MIEIRTLTATVTSTVPSSLPLAGSAAGAVRLRCNYIAGPSDYRKSWKLETGLVVLGGWPSAGTSSQLLESVCQLASHLLLRTAKLAQQASGLSDPLRPSQHITCFHSRRSLFWSVLVSSFYLISLHNGKFLPIAQSSFTTLFPSPLHLVSSSICVLEVPSSPPVKLFGSTATFLSVLNNQSRHFRVSILQRVRTTLRKHIATDTIFGTARRQASGVTSDTSHLEGF